MPSASNQNYIGSNLAAAEVFTGAWEPVPADTIMVTAYTDQTGTLQLQFRRDANSTVETEDITIRASVHERVFRFSGKREFRIVYTNGSTATTTIEIAPHFGDYSDTGASAANKISSTDFNSRASATLAAAATFQGVGEDVSGYGRVGVAITSANATDGTLTMEVSHDNVTWGGPTRTWANTQIAAPHMWNIVEKYFRIKYVNGSTEAAALSIQVQYSNNADILLGHQLTETLPKEVEAIVTRPGSDFGLDAARRQIDGKRAFFFFGFNALVGTAYEDIWAGGGNINWLTTPTKVEVLSGHAADTATGLGVQSVELHGLSSSGADQSELIAMNGTAAVSSSKTYSRINKLHSETCGTYGGSHQGIITCRVLTGGSIQSLMTGVETTAGASVQYGSGEAGNGFWSVPLGKVMYITRLQVIPNFGANNKTIDIALYEREDILDVTTPFAPRRVLWAESGVETSIEKEFKSHIKIKALTDVWFRALGSAASKVEVYLDFYLLDENEDGA